MKEQKESMVFYKAFYDTIELNPDETIKAKCYKAIIHYAIYGESLEVDDLLVKSIFGICKPSIDANIERYQKSIENGKKRGAPMGNQNARKNDMPIKLPEVHLTQFENKNNSIQFKNNSKTIQFNSNNLTDTDTVTDNVTDNVTDTYTETENENEHNCFSSLSEISLSSNNNSNYQNKSSHLFNYQDNININKQNNINQLNINEFSLEEYEKYYVPLGVEEDLFFNIKNKFIENFPNKNNKLKKFGELNELNYNLIDIEKLLNKIKSSNFLLSNNNLGLEWCLINYDKILSGNYDNFTIPNSPQNSNGNYYQNLTPKEKSYANSLDRYKKANNFYTKEGFFETDFDALIKELEEEDKRNQNAENLSQNEPNSPFKNPFKSTTFPL